MRRVTARRLAAGALVATAILAGRAPSGARPAFAAPVEAYQRTAVWASDPAAIPPEAFREPRGVTVDPFDGTVFVVDGGNERVQVFAADGAFVRTIGGPGAGPEGLDDPQDVAVEGSLVFVTDDGHDRVALFTVEGAYLGQWPGLAGPQGIAVGGDGRVFVVENAASRIAVFRANGQRLATWGRFGMGDGQLNRPGGLDVTADGRLVVADTGNARVVVLDRDGVQVRESATLPAAPLDVVVDRNTDVYFTRADGALGRIEDRLGLPVDGRTWPLAGAVGLGGAPDLALYATFQDDQRPKHGVHRWAGRPLADDVEWGGVPAPLGVIDAPARLAAADQVLVADSWRRVQVFDAGGRALLQVPAGGVNDMAPGPDGDVFVVRDDAVARLGPDGTPRWTGALAVAGGDYAWAVAIDYDPGLDRLAVLDVGAQRFRTYAGDGTPGAEGSFRPAPGTSVPLWDVARAPGGEVWAVNRRADTVERRAVTGGPALGSWPVPGGPLRVASDDTGRAYVLNRRGWVWKFAPDGTLVAVWPVGEPADPRSRPVDVAVDSGGRVLVADAGLDRVEVYARDPAGTPGPVPSFDPSCGAAGEKWADPTRLTLGEETQVTLEVSGACPPVESAPDVVLVLDHSGSMLGAPMDAAQDGALAFVEATDFGAAQVGVVGFNQNALLLQGLTGNQAAVEQAIRGLAAGGGTNIAAGVDEARRELAGRRRRPAAPAVIVLMTDGVNNGGPPPALRAAEQSKLDGARLFAIAFGAAADVATLQAMASGPADFYDAPVPADLAGIYRTIASRLSASVLFTTLTITDLLPANMAYVPASGVPAPAQSGQTLVWQLADVPLGGATLTYRVRPLEDGTWPTNVLAVGEGTDGLGQRGRVDFPVPTVVVVAPTGTPAPSPTPAATPTPGPTATARPLLPVYLPVVKNEACVARREHADVVLVVDTSDSMLAPTRAGRTKLEAAVDAARGFVGLLDLEADAAAVVGFNTEAGIAQPLTREGAALRGALGRLPQGPGTRIDLGLRRAAEALAGPGRHAENRPVIVLLTDGRPTGTTSAEVEAAAGALRGAGVEVYAIGLGDDLDAELLGRLASGPSHRILAPDAEDLAAIYAAIARDLPCVVP